MSTDQSPCGWKRLDRAALASILVLILLAGAGALTIRETTRFGSGLRDDSFVYMSSAEGIATFAGYGRFTGDGSFRPITSFPPLYSFALAVTEWVGLGVHAGVRLLGGAGFGLTILLVGFVVLYATRSGLTALLSAVATLISPALLDLFSWALSESLFIPLSLACVGTMLVVLQGADHRKIWIPGVMSGLALLTRYAAFALVAALGASVLLDRSTSQRRRLRALALYSILSLSPIAAFLARNLLLTGNLANRPSPRWNPPDQELVRNAGRIIAGWFIPGFEAGIADWQALLVPLLLAIALGAAMRFVWLRSTTQHPMPKNRAPIWLVFVAGAYAACHLLLLLASMTLIDVNIQSGFSVVGERLLLPIYVCLLLILAVVFHAAWRSGTPIRRIAVLGLAMAFMGFQIASGLRMFQELRSEGRGYNSLEWRTSPTLEYVRGLPDVPIFTNDLGAVYLLTGRYATFVPARYNPSTGKPRRDYAANLSLMKQTLRQDGGVVLILGSGPWGRLDQDHLAELTEGTSLIAEYGDGLIFRYEPDASQ